MLSEVYQPTTNPAQEIPKAFNLWLNFSNHLTHSLSGIGYLFVTVNLKEIQIWNTDLISFICSWSQSSLPCFNVCFYM